MQMNLCVKVTLDEHVRPIALELVLTASVFAITTSFIHLTIYGRVSIKMLNLTLFHMKIVQMALAANGHNVKSQLTRKL